MTSDREIRRETEEELRMLKGMERVEGELSEKNVKRRKFLESRVKRMGISDGIASEVEREVERSKEAWEWTPEAFMRKMGYLNVPLSELGKMLGVEEKEFKEYEKEYERGGVIFNLHARETALKKAMGGKEKTSEMLKMVLKSRLPKEYKDDDKKGGDTVFNFQKGMKEMRRRARELGQVPKEIAPAPAPAPAPAKERKGDLF